MSRTHALGAMLVVGASFVGFSSFLVLMAFLELLPWRDAGKAVEAFSSLATLGVGAVVGLYLGSGPSGSNPS